MLSVPEHTVKQVFRPPMGLTRMMPKAKSYFLLARNASAEGGGGTGRREGGAEVSWAVAPTGLA